MRENVMDMLAPYREKWREVPGGDDASARYFSTDLLAMTDGKFLALWEEHAAKRVTSSLSWLGPLYRDFFAGRRVLELGSGLGLDGLRFAAQGAKWTFADIAAENLKVIERVASLKGLRVKTFLIGNDLSFDALGGEFDAILASGSMHHVPFEMAREECLSALRRLKPGGRWIELAYPKERWIRDGSPPFDHWGKATDGERTPWAEWYDAEKLRARLGPATFATILDFGFFDDNFRWFDFLYAPELAKLALQPPRPTFVQRLRAAWKAASDWSYIERSVSIRKMGMQVLAEKTKSLPGLDEGLETVGGRPLPADFLGDPYVSEDAAIRGGRTSAVAEASTSVDRPDGWQSALATILDVVIDTSSVSYRYAIVINANAEMVRNLGAGGLVTLEISLEVIAGRLGIVWTDAEYYPIEATERYVAAMPGVQHVLVSVPSERVHHVVIRNVAPKVTSFRLMSMRAKANR